jgi:hypothetical protein
MNKSLYTQGYMTIAITRRLSPEERELEKKKAELAALEVTLAQQELELTTLQATLRAFERRYLSVVGARYAELDELQAQLAEAQARRNPQNIEAHARAEQARTQAHESAHTTAAASQGPQKFEPSDSLKKLWREACKRIHPDQVTDPKERERRNKVMAEVNRAYEDGDEARLQAILYEWADSPETIQGEGVAAELVRVIRKLAQIEERLRVIAVQLNQLKASDLYQLKNKVDAAAAEGRDLLAEMVVHVEAQLAEARKRLLDLEIDDVEKQLAELRRRRANL